MREAAGVSTTTFRHRPPTEAPQFIQEAGAVQTELRPIPDVVGHVSVSVPRPAGPDLALLKRHAVRADTVNTNTDSSTNPTPHDMGLAASQDGTASSHRLRPRTARCRAGPPRHDR